MAESSIKCPSCGVDVDVNDILKHRIEATLRKEFQTKAGEQAKILEQKNMQFETAKADFEARKKNENDLFAERLEKAKKEALVEIGATVKKKITEEHQEMLTLMEKELEQKSKELIELNKTKAQLAQSEREKLEMRDAIMVELDKKLNQQIVAEREKIKKQEDDKNELRFKELILQLEQQKKLTEEMKRKQEQGSMQLQGEVMEIAIEEWLSSTFPLDTIDEIKKGANGADCVQIVNTRDVHNCGTIYYESKRAKNFSPAWIEKFKNDIRDKKANIGVLVTEVLPSGMDRMGLREGIWICTFDEFKGLSAVLRETIIKLNTAVQSRENSGEKMAMLYDFLTSNEFRLQMEGIVEGFSTMQADLDSEKRSMMSHWKKREKQIDKVISNTVHMYGSIRGIAGTAIQKVAALEIEAIDDSLFDKGDD